jgi:hypothetical protein
MYRRILEVSRICARVDRERSYRLHKEALAKIKGKPGRKTKSTLSQGRRAAVTSEQQKQTQSTNTMTRQTQNSTDIVVITPTFEHGKMRDEYRFPLVKKIILEKKPPRMPPKNGRLPPISQPFFLCELDATKCHRE